LSAGVSCVALFTHHVGEVSSDVLAVAVPILRERGIRLLLPPGEALKHPQLRNAPSEGCCEVAREELREADLCLVFGGDGTMLRALRMTRDLGVPVAGVNLGRVGYLATVDRDRIEEDLPRLLEGDFVVQPMLGLTTRSDGATLRAVNDLVVGRGREGGICHLSYSINGTEMFDLRCDALIVATPAGSTAYNLAVGGPVVGLGVDGFVVSYVAPHTLTVRSVIAAATDTVAVVNRSAHYPVDVLSDGEHVATLPPLETLEIRTTPALATLALLPGTDFYKHFAQRFT
jgi:NAD+ kinase